MPIPDLPSSLIDLGYAGAAGLLIGLERGWTLRRGLQGSRIAGVRTFSLLGLAGGIAAQLPPALAVTLLGLLGLSLVAAYVRTTDRPDQHSITATIAALLTLGLGALATAGAPSLAIAGAAIATILLTSRAPLHALLRGICEPEMRAGARFAVIAFVLLPLAPDARMGPFAAWNPHELWLIVVLVSGLSFIGYVLHARIADQRGIAFGALAAAIVSSTVATVTLARRLDASPGASAFGTAIIAANIVMLTRVLVIAGMFVPFVLPHLALLLAPALAMSVLASLFGWWRERGGIAPAGPGMIPVGNPLDLRAALGLAGLVAMASLIGHWILADFGHLALGILLALIGMFDVDAAIFTIAGLPTDRIAPLAAASALTAPILLNMVAKAALTAGLARERAGYRPALCLAAAAALSGAALVALG